MHVRSQLPCFVVIFFISRKWYSIGEILKRIFFRNSGNARLVAVERDVKPPNMNFAKVEKRGERLIGRWCLYR